MSNRTLCCAVVLSIAELAGAGPRAVAADYTTIVLSTVVTQPASQVWKKIGGFCDIGAWLKLKCVYTSGTGGLGTVRQLAGRIDELMVGETPHSYTYTQPANKSLYHGTVDVEPMGPHRSKIVYSIVYDQSRLAPGETPDAYRAQHIKMFTGALNSMKKAAEGQ